MKQLLHADDPRRDSLRVMVLDEGFEHVPVGRQTVGPEILTHERMGAAQLLLDERQRDLGRRRVREILQRQTLRPLERFEERHRQPWLPFHDRPPDPDQVHDRKYPRAPEIVDCLLRGVFEQPAERLVGRDEGAWRARADESVDVARLQHRIQCLVGADIFERDAGGERDGQFFQPPRFFETAAHPSDIRRLHAVIFVQQRARPDIGRELPFGSADPSPLEVLRRPDSAIAAHDDRSVAERA